MPTIYCLLLEHVHLPLMPAVPVVVPPNTANSAKNIECPLFCEEGEHKISDWGSKHISRELLSNKGCWWHSSENSWRWRSWKMLIWFHSMPACLNICGKKMLIGYQVWFQANVSPKTGWDGELASMVQAHLWLPDIWCVYACMCVIHTLCMRPFPPIINWWWQTSPPEGI